MTKAELLNQSYQEWIAAGREREDAENDAMTTAEHWGAEIEHLPFTGFIARFKDGSETLIGV